MIEFNEKDAMNGIMNEMYEINGRSGMDIMSEIR